MNNIFTDNLRGFGVKLKLRPGVFSPGGVDQGTRILIDNLEIEDGELVADLASGGGVLGIVCAKLNPKGRVHLLDDHLRSVELAKQNVELNGLRNVEVFSSDLFSAVPDRTYDQILSNPPQQLGNDFLEELINESFKHLKPGGSLWLVVKTNLRSVFERFLEENFQGVKIITHSKGYLVLKGIKNG